MTDRTPPAGVASTEPLLRPDATAVVGAGRTPGSVAGRPAPRSVGRAVHLRAGVASRGGVTVLDAPVRLLPRRPTTPACAGSLRKEGT